MISSLLEEIILLSALSDLSNTLLSEIVVKFPDGSVVRIVYED